MGKYVPLHHPDGDDGGAVSFIYLNELPVEARWSVSEGLLTLSKQLYWIRGTYRGSPLLLHDKPIIIHTISSQGEDLTSYLQ